MGSHTVEIIALVIALIALTNLFANWHPWRHRKVTNLFANWHPGAIAKRPKNKDSSGR